MASLKKWVLKDEDKDRFVDALTHNLTALRAKAGISQGDLSNLVGVSRQTYGAIEGNLRRMSWNTYLSLVLFFDYNQATHQMLRDVGAFPSELIERLNRTVKEVTFDSSVLFGPQSMSMMACLDESALHVLRSVLMVEYARCTNLDGEAIIRSFDGYTYSPERLIMEHSAAARTVRKVRQHRKHIEE